MNISTLLFGRRLANCCRSSGHRHCPGGHPVCQVAEGVWIILVVVPLTVVVLKSVRSYYDAVDRDLRETGPITLEGVEPPAVLVVAQQWNRLSERAVTFALTISPDVVAVHLSKLEGPENEDSEQLLRHEWRVDVEEPVRARGLNPPRLLFIPAPFRKLHEPLLRLIEKIDAEDPERRVAVLIPETIKSRWWQNLLHLHRSGRLRAKLLRHGGPRLTVITVPWRLSHATSEG